MLKEISRRDLFRHALMAASSFAAVTIFNRIEDRFKLSPEHKKTFSESSFTVLNRPEVSRISYRRSPAERKTEQFDLSPISPDEQFLCERINAFRADSGLSTLVIDPFLSAWARGRSQNMASENYFGHYTPDGGFPLADLQSNCSGTGPTLGENIQRNNLPDYLNKALSDWFNSPSHLENITGPYSVFGMGAACDVNGIWYFTNVFASDYCVAPSGPTGDSSTS